MKKFLPFTGLFLIIRGTIVLLTTRLGHLATHNSLLIAGLLLITLGILLHIRFIKHQSRY